VRKGEGDPHCDSEGPRRTAFVLDGPSRLERRVFLQKSKAETFEKFKNLEAWFLNQHGRNVGMLHSDRGGEYTSTLMTRQNTME